VNNAIYEKLKEAASAKPEKLLHYSDIAPLAGLDMSLQEDRNTLSAMLGEISTYEYKQGHPLLSAIVVLKGDPPMPGKGFFTLAAELGRLQPGQDKGDFWAEEVRRVLAQWQKP
jgi:hypothetical protein